MSESDDLFETVARQRRRAPCEATADDRGASPALDQV